MGSSSLWSHTTQTGEEGAEGILDPIMEGVGIPDQAMGMEVAGILDPIQAMVVPGIPTQTMKTEEVTIQDQITAMAMEVAGILVPIMAMEEVGIRDPGPVDQVACCCHVHMCRDES